MAIAKQLLLKTLRAAGYELCKITAAGDQRVGDLEPAFEALQRTAITETGAAAVFDRVLKDIVHPFHRSIFWGDRLLTLDKSASFRVDPKFAAAVRQMSGDTGATQYASPDGISWRLNTLAWAARCALHVPGDFVECGVYQGDMSWVITELVDIGSAGRTFYLYDTFEGFAQQYSSQADFPEAPEFFERAQQAYHQPLLYEQVCARFAVKPYVAVVKGAVPDALRVRAPDRVAFLHIDMNSPAPEIGALDVLFDRVSPGGVIVFDDYGWLLHHNQKHAADQFMADRGYDILELPTGQGLVIRR